MTILAIIVFSANDHIQIENYYLDYVNFFFRRKVKYVIKGVAKVILSRVKNHYKNNTKFISLEPNEEMLEQLLDLNKNFKNIRCSYYMNCNETFCIITNDYIRKLSLMNLMKLLIELYYKKDKQLSNTDLYVFINKYHDPDSVNIFFKTEREIEDVRNVMLESIEKILDRGEKLEDLLFRTNDLEISSKNFKKSSSSLNSCCVLF